MISRTPLLAALLLGLSGAAAAQEPPKDKPVITPPPPPEELRQQEDMPEGEPQVTIIQRDWARIEEYSYAGRVYAVRIEPAVGAPYYLYDSDGDGSLETRRNGPVGGMPEINQWKILTW